MLDDRALGANLAAILAAVRPRAGDTAVSWLPLSHDMGLVGMLLTSIAASAPDHAGRVDIVLLDPEQFLRAPRLWLRAISHWNGTFSAVPDFGLRLALRGSAAGLDLHALRCLIVGGEVVRAGTLDELTTVLGPAGLDPRAVCPAYGMAEIGLAASMTRPGDPWRSRPASRRALAGHDLAPPAGPEDHLTLVSSGRALPGYRITAEGPVGALTIAGPSIGIDGRTGRSFAGTDGRLVTNDLGFVDDGWVYVCGRTDDYFVANGRNIFAPEVEDAVSRVPGVRPGRVTVVGTPEGDWVLVAEPAGP